MEGNLSAFPICKPYVVHKACKLVYLNGNYTTNIVHVLFKTSVVLDHLDLI